MAREALEPAAPKASLFALVFVALLGLYVVPATFVGGAMADATDSTVLPRLGLAAAIVVAFGVVALLMVGAVRALLRPRISDAPLTVLLTLLTLALVWLSLKPALRLVFWFWPAAG